MLPCLLLVGFFSTRLRLCALTPRQKVPCCPAVLTRAQRVPVSCPCLLLTCPSKEAVAKNSPEVGANLSMGHKEEEDTSTSSNDGDGPQFCGGSRSGDDVRHDVEGKREGATSVAS